jgi:hypothetical protein
VTIIAPSSGELFPRPAATQVEGSGQEMTSSWPFSIPSGPLVQVLPELSVARSEPVSYPESTKHSEVVGHEIPALPGPAISCMKIDDGTGCVVHVAPPFVVATMVRSLLLVPPTT